jgi:hypothetical protein
MSDSIDKSVEESARSIDQQVYNLALTDLYKKGDITDAYACKNILDFNIKRAEEAELKLNTLIDAIKEMSGK